MASVISPAPAPSAPPAAAGAAAAGGRRGRLLSNRGIVVAAALSAGAGLVHLEVTPTHWWQWWGYGLFFLLTGLGQLAYAAVLVRWPVAPVLWFGAVGNLAIVALYGYTRTNGIPTGPAVGHIEAAGSGDFITTAGEFVLAGMLIAALGPRARSGAMTVLMLAGVGIWILRLTNTIL